MKNYTHLLRIVLFLMISMGQLMAQGPVPVFLKHVVKKGDTPASIAAAYNIDKTDFLLLNDFPSDIKLATGQEVLIRTLRKGEVIGQGNGSSLPGVNDLGGEAQSQPTGFLKHTVKRGDSPASIASDYGLAKKDFLLLNDFPENMALEPGQEVLIRALRKGEAAKKPSLEASASTADATPHIYRKADSYSLPQKPAPARAAVKSVETGPNGAQYKVSESQYHTVQSKQTFYRIALIYGLSVDELKSLNNMTGTDISVGQRLRVAR